MMVIVNTKGGPGISGNMGNMDSRGALYCLLLALGCILYTHTEGVFILCHLKYWKLKVQRAFQTPSEKLEMDKKATFQLLMFSEKFKYNDVERGNNR